MRSPPVWVVKASDRRDLSVDRLRHVGIEKAQESEARTPPHAARVFETRDRVLSAPSHRRILVEA
jgi:hypothetical protein